MDKQGGISVYDGLLRVILARSRKEGNSIPAGPDLKNQALFSSLKIEGGKKHMANNEPNKPENIKIEPANDTPKEPAAPISEPLAADKQTESPEVEADKVATLPGSGDVVVSFDKINEIISDKKEQEISAPEKKVGRGSRPPKSDKANQEPKPEKNPKTEKSAKAPKPKKEKQTADIGGAGGSVSAKSTKQAKQETPAPERPPEPREAPRTGEKEEIVHLNLSELHPFKGHPFQVKNDEEMRAMVESIKDKGVTQAAIVRPREDGGYEIVSGHRRQMASELAGFTNMPCIVRNLTDEQAITQMVEDNTTQRESILPSERAKALQMQLEAIKKQGARTGNGQRSNEVVAERNKMTVKQVQRYIKLNDLVPDLLKMVDEKKVSFTPAVEMAFIKPKNQQYIAVAIEGQQSAPSLSQAQRMRELDQKNVLKPDMIDGIMLEEKKEADKVILSSQELGQFFGKDKTPREMKDTIMKLLEENKDKLKDISAPEKKAEQEK